MFLPSIFENQCVDFRRSMWRLSKIDVSPFEDRWSMCRPSKIDGRCEIRLLYLLKTLAVCKLRRGFALQCFHCICPVCMYVCMCVCPLIHVSSASHIGITQQRYQWVHSNTAIILNFADFPKNASFKSYGIICLPRAAPASYSFSLKK